MKQKIISFLLVFILMFCSLDLSVFAGQINTITISDNDDTTKDEDVSTNEEKAFGEKNYSVVLSENIVGGDCGAEGDNVQWSLDLNTGVLTISGSGDMEYYFDSSSNPMSAYKDYIKTLQISEGVTSIGGYAFYGCSGLTGNLTLPESLISIGSYAFYGCSGFTGSLTLPESMTNIDYDVFIGSYAFYGCSGFTGSLTIPEGVTGIGDMAFAGCSGFTGSLALPESLTSIGSWAFSECSGFTGSLTIPESVTSIDNNAFDGCSGFTGSLALPESLTSIDQDAFARCSGFTGSLTIPESVTSIGVGAFFRCSGFTGSLTIPEGVTSIGSMAFCGCSGFTGSLTIPEGVTHIGDDAFSGCSGFTGSLTIPEGVTSIGSMAFYCCSGFTGSLTLPESLTSIDGCAFEGCSGFTGSLTIPEGVTRIGACAFEGCSGFTGNLIIPYGVKEIKSSTFERCLGLSGYEVYLHEDIGTIGEDNFYDVQYMWEGDSYKPIYKPIDVTIVCPEGSYAEQWAKDNGFKVKLQNSSVNKSSYQITGNFAGIKVSDKSSKKIIENATILDGSESYTGTNLIQIPMTGSTIQKTLTISADGYYAVNKNVTLKKGQVTYIALPKKNSDSEAVILDITGAYNSKVYDFMSQSFEMAYVPNTTTLSDLTYGTVDIIVDATGNIRKYELMQGDTVIQSNTNGRFSLSVIKSAGGITYTSPVTTELVNGKKVHVRITDINGNQVTEALSIKISTSYTSEETQTQTGKFLIGKSLKITVPENVPLVGGGTLDIGLGEEKLPIELSIDNDGKVRFALNMKPTTSMDKFEEQYKHITSKAKKASNAAKALGGTPQKFGAGFFNVTGTIYGYGEGNISELKQGNITLQVGVYAEIEGKGGYKQYFFVGFVPLKLFVEGSVSAKPELQAKLVVQNYKITDFDFSGGSFNAKVQLTVGGGVGVGVEVNASASGSLNYTYKPGREYQKVWMDASGKVSLVVGWFEKDLWKSKKYSKVLYETGTDKNKIPIVNVSNTSGESIVLNESFRPMSRAYLSSRAGYQALATTYGMESVHTEAVEKQTIKAAVYPSADQRLVSVGGKQYLFWLEDIITRSSNNRAALVYSVSEDGKRWSTPVGIVAESENATPDLGYDIYESGNKIYIVWQDGTRELGDEEDITAMVQSMSVRMAVLDTATNQMNVSEALTQNAAYYMLPQITSDGTDVYVAYVENVLNGESIVGNNTHKFRYSVNGGESKQIDLTAGYQIVNMDLGTFSNNVYAICEMDTDGDIWTDADRELFALDLKNGTSIRLTENEVSDTYPVLSDSANLYWNHENEINVLGSMQDEAAIVMQGEELSSAAVFSVVTTSEGKDWILFENADWDENGTLAVYGIEQTAEKQYENAVKLIDTEGGIISKVTAIYKNEQLIVGVLEGDFLEEGTILKDLCLYNVGKNTDIAVVDVTYDETQAAAGNALTLRVNCLNEGNVAIQNAEIFVDGTIIGTLSDLNLKPGESRELAVEGYVVPDGLTELKESTLTVKVAEDSNLQNNETKFLIGLPDVAVTASTRLLEGHHWIDIVLNNETDFKTCGTLRVIKDSLEGEIVFETRFDDLIKGTTSGYTVSLENYDNECMNYYVVAESDSEEGNFGNNSTYIYIGYGSGVENVRQDSEDAELSAISITDSEVTMHIGENHALSVNTTPENVVDNTDLLWSSSNPKVVSVDENGILTALMSGSTVITANYGELSAECSVTVLTNEMQTITILFDTQSSKRVEPLSGIPVGSTVDLPELEADGDNTFDGWYTQAEGGELVTNDYVFTKSMTIYAHWSDTPKGLWAKKLADETYTGKAVKPKPVVYDENTLLEEGMDYTLSYKNNIKVNDAMIQSEAPTVIIKGKGNYSGSVTATFKIVPKSLEDEDVTAENMTVIANGKLQKVVPVVTWGGKRLKNNKDFYVSYSNDYLSAYDQPGTYSVTIEGTGCYSGMRMVTLTVAPDTAISVKKLTISKLSAQTYQDGRAIKPEPVVKYKGVLLTKGLDYSVSYENNTDVGTARAIITGLANGESIYAGSRVITFKITGMPISKAVIEYENKVEYDGTAKEPGISVSLNGKTLQKNKDYTVEYQKNVNAGKATILVKGIGGYTGSVKKAFSIVAYDIAQKKIQIEEEQTLSASYEKTGAKPAIIVTYGEWELKLGKDYTLSYKNNKKISDKKAEKAPTVVIKGKGNFKGSRTVTYDIVKKDLSDENNSIIITAPDVTMNEKGAYKTKITVKDSMGKKLVVNKDYEIVGYYVGDDGSEELPEKTFLTTGTKLRVVIKGIGNYKGTKEAVYKVMQYDLSKVSFKIANQVYTGKEITFDAEDFGSLEAIWVKVKPEQPAPIYGQDYIITEYRNNIYTGKATVVLKGISDTWGGTKAVTFRITSKQMKWFWDLLF